MSVTCPLVPCVTCPALSRGGWILLATEVISLWDPPLSDSSPKTRKGPSRSFSVARVSPRFVSFSPSSRLTPLFYIVLIIFIQFTCQVRERTPDDIRHSLLPKRWVSETGHTLEVSMSCSPFSLVEFGSTTLPGVLGYTPGTLCGTVRRRETR